MLILNALILLVSFGALAQSLPGAPTDPLHPGSKSYSYSYSEKAIECDDREVVLFIPNGPTQNKKFPVVVYGHGQALGLDYYRDTFVHLAKKGVAVIFPEYDVSFFDQNWRRMGKDYISLTECAFSQYATQLNSHAIVFSGHSKGAYVAGVAAGIAGNNGVNCHPIHPKATILFEPAGVNIAEIRAIDPKSSVTVVYSDADTIVEREISEEIYRFSPSERTQFITVKSYLGTDPEIEAGHMWPLTKPTFFFGGNYENPLHFYGAWKWLTAAALDLEGAKLFENPYLYGPLAVDKGLNGLNDEIQRNW